MSAIEPSSEAAKLSHPAGTAIDKAGNLWVVDKAHNRIVEYNASGEFIRTAGSLGSGAGQLKSPSAITIDTWGYLDVADTANNRVVRFDPEGNFQSVIGANVDKTKVEAGGTLGEKNHCTAASGDVCQAGTTGSGEGLMAEPVGIATSAGSGGLFYVVERADNRVEKFNTNGELQAKFGSAGSGNGQFKEPSAIAIGPNALWVADTGNNRIAKWSFSWVYQSQFGKEGSGNGELKHPAAVEVDSSGNVWVGDQGNNRVQKFSEAGGYLQKFGTGGSAEGQFEDPLGDAGQFAKGLVERALHIYGETKGSTEFTYSLLKAGLSAYIKSASAPDQQWAWACAKGFSEGIEETGGLAEGALPEKAIAGGWAVIRCLTESAVE